MGVYLSKSLKHHINYNPEIEKRNFKLLEILAAYPCG